MLRIFKKYYPIRNIFFVIGEGLFIYGSFLLAFWLVIGFEILVVPHLIFPKILLITLVCQSCLYYNDLYDLKVSKSIEELGIRLLQSLGFAAIVMAIVYIVFPDAIIGRGIFLVSIFFIIFFIVSWRLAYFKVLKQGLFDQKIILLGSGELATKIRNEIEDRKDCGYKISLEVPEETCDLDRSDTNAPAIVCCKNAEGICDLANTLEIKKIIVSLKEKRDKFPINELLKCRVEGIEVLEDNTFYEMLTGKLVVDAINPSWLIFSEGFHKSRFRRFAKRTSDLVLSFLLLFFLSPLIFIAAILIKMDSQGPIFFSQERVGEKGKFFWVHKFRSMVCDAENACGPVWAEENDHRITRVGRVIRKLRIDELPQLYNVLKGEMSFVGPRPERQFFVEQLEKKIPYYAERHSVRPGITGWAQICYNYGATVEDAVEKLNYDLFYIKNMSALMDLFIVLRTIKIVLFGKGAR